MMDYLVAFSTWVENNAGQIQIFIALVAIWYVLKQIKISNNQTDLSIRQTNISIAQMEKLNSERIFELRLRLRIKIGEHSNALMELQDASNNLSLRFQILSIDTKDNHPGSVDGIESMIKVWRESITSAWDIVSTKSKGNNFYLERVSTTTDIVFMEEILDKVEQNQLIYQAKMREIRNLDEHVTNVWMPMNMGVMEAMKVIHNFK